ncbi:hypothetical protein SKAU_G00302010 [Synaphobranchus kaupii]|uniref:Uncharacterized protein n=1 Tax=Synaphobranchus kaupii TaxID=118154 RepID=A0A9Q1EVX6_SYNKA|nr:hypothetical protein SKAU_G00302010 [Synaphobranchus kaupii]
MKASLSEPTPSPRSGTCTQTSVPELGQARPVSRGAADRRAARRPRNVALHHAGRHAGLLRDDHFHMDGSTGGLCLQQLIPQTCLWVRSPRHVGAMENLLKLQSTDCQSSGNRCRCRTADKQRSHDVAAALRRRANVATVLQPHCENGTLAESLR